MGRTDVQTKLPHHRGRWLFGLACLGLVIWVVWQRAEERKFIVLVERSEPAWLIVAVALQALTYLCQASIFRLASSQSGTRLSWSEAIRASFTKLLADQTLPFPGSGTVMAAQALALRGVVQPVLAALVAIHTLSYYVASFSALLLAVLAAALLGRANPWIWVAFVLFSASAGLLLCTLMRLALGKRLPGETVWHRVPGWDPLKHFLMAAKDVLSNRAAVVRGVFLQFLLLGLDIATLWLVVRALGVAAPPLGIFVSFMLGVLAQPITLLPGGLGVYEAATTAALALTGLPEPVALSATLLFRGLSYWLPLVPGVVISQRMMKPLVETNHSSFDYWSQPIEALLDHLQTLVSGLSSEEAQRRLVRYGYNEIHEEHGVRGWSVLVAQVKSSLLLLLGFASLVSMLVGEWFDALLVIVILAASVVVGFVREYQAQRAVNKLSARIRLHTWVVRDGVATKVANCEIVPGDVVLLSAGSLVPADSRLVETSNLFLSEAILTGESVPVEKRVGEVSPDTSLIYRTNCVFQGTNVLSGTGRCLVVATGRSTELGKIAHRIALRPAETDFDRGLRQFGNLLLVTALSMVLVIFAVNVFLNKPPVTTLLFSLALAVGLSPELLPAMLNVNLARAAKRMAEMGVLVKRLNAIETLGSMDVLCTDKTGTSTEGVVRLDGSWDDKGILTDMVLELAGVNAALQTGISNPLDTAILQACSPLPETKKLGEIAYDFTRKRMSVIVEDNARARLVTKGAFRKVLEACSSVARHTLTPDEARRLQRLYEDWTQEGKRVLAVATRTMEPRSSYSPTDEVDLNFEGFLTFLDRPKENIRETVENLRRLGVQLKVITGDSARVAAQVAKQIGFNEPTTITGIQLDRVRDEALWQLAQKTDIFAEVDPNQKERIIVALKKWRRVVGFLGDGVNDAPAMHAADVSLSVEGAVDVAREAADFVLLRRDLSVIGQGLEEGRKTFANTLKYILIATSSNVGNMISMAIASLMLPFLPLLPGQILLNNLLSGILAIAIASDSVDPEQIGKTPALEYRVHWALHA